MRRVQRLSIAIAVLLALPACRPARPSSTGPAPRQSAAPTGPFVPIERREPLYVIDGVVLPDSLVDRLPPRDSIAQIEVLKGAAARARYGDDGAAGVVILTTKRKHAKR